MLNLTLDIATSNNKDSKKWKNRKMKWADFVNRLSEPYHTKESFKEFMLMSKDEQGHVKDVGAYFGGYIRNGRRLKSNILHRQLLTLDIDFANYDFFDYFSLYFDCAAIVHGTHKHCEDSPRLRLLIPLDREVTPEEYTAISRQVAGMLEIEWFDPTTFDTNRFMFWQSSPKDIEYYFQYQDGEPLSANDILQSYVDWTDISSYPRHSKELENDRTIADKAENPKEKRGVIGFFCRTYTIQEVIEHYLNEVYSPTEYDANRYTYNEGSTFGGAIIYEDMFLYSHHGTDPVCNRLVNSYDLVRLQVFDGESETESVRKMDELVLADENVKRTIAQEKLDGLKDFDDIEIDDEEFSDEPEEDAANWMKQMDSDKKGNYLPTARNLSKIIKHDKWLKGRFKFNMFANRVYVMKNLPWRKIPKPESIRNVDLSGLRNYIETVYGIGQASAKIDDSRELEAYKNRYHPVREYLGRLKWDGKERLRSLFTYWLGAEDSEYTFAVTKHFMMGAVSRIFNPGIKFDSILTFVGEQGVGKSEIVSKLGGDWYSDSLMTIKGKDGLEALQGYWIIEMAELSGLRRADTEAQKHFTAKKKDSFRVAYGHVVEDYPRQNVFIATTNEDLFLKDMSGNRRYLPIRVSKANQGKHPIYMTQAYIDQIWAEAVEVYSFEGYQDIANLAEIQQAFLETDPRTPQIEEYLDKPIPKDFYDLSIDERVLFYEMPDHSTKKMMYRDKICPMEIHVECLGGKMATLSRMEFRAIRDIIMSLGWKPSEHPTRVKGYGSQRCFERPYNYE